MKAYVDDGVAIEGPAYQYTGDDGVLTSVLVPVLVATDTKKGKMYQLPNQIKIDYDEDGFQIVKYRFTLQKAREMLKIFRSRGWIETEHWVEIDEPTLKEYLRGAYY